MRQLAAAATRLAVDLDHPLYDCFYLAQCGSLALGLGRAVRREWFEVLEVSQGPVRRLVSVARNSKLAVAAERCRRSEQR